MAMLFAAIHPERWRRSSSTARSPACSRATRLPAGRHRGHYRRSSAAQRQELGRAGRARALGPEPAGDAGFRGGGRGCCAGGQPGHGAQHLRALPQLDIREVLPAIHVPTLVLHRDGGRDHRAAGRQPSPTAIPGAQIRRARRAPTTCSSRATPTPCSTRSRSSSPASGRAARADRVLATVLFTDIVGSTERAAELGDARWRELLEQPRRARPARARALPRPRGQDDGRRFPRHVRRTGARDPLRDARSATRCGRSGSRCAPGCTPASSSCIGDDIGGIAVHIGARVGSAGRARARCSSRAPSRTSSPGRASRSTDRGEHALKGVPGEWGLFAVDS